ncbi:AraC family transcriptional regulator [Pseudomonas sp. M47T1]|uniref:AraC family transcriptional regulator n=1 Tax=Pseudomonas sp. M47T1 TaxID=1179778 RepID=UPI0002607D86|nr:AraC family transcriptional regulator [Pseudomonas sp. M47T1]EIK96252.1 AraC family transcriptional regulator [Pseudomonas sp. M47T1]
MSTFHTIATWAQVIARTLEAQGIASGPLLHEAGIGRFNLHDPNQRIELEGMSAFWRAARRASGDECFGLRVAACSYPTDFHGLQFAVQSSSTFIEALERGVRFAPVITTAAVMGLLRGPQVTRLIYGVADGAQVEQMATEASIACAVSFTRQTWPGLPIVLGVHLARALPANPQRWAELLGCPVHFGAAHNAIDYANRWLQTPLNTANLEVAQGLDAVLDGYLERQRRLNLPQRVRSAILRDLPLGEVQQSRVADELGMSVRNLHRHLLKHSTSFKALVDDCRRQLAFGYLRRSDCSINEVCYRLGFNEPSSFNRAFRRWTGASPGQWRRHDQGGMASAQAPQHLSIAV